MSRKKVKRSNVKKSAVKVKHQVKDVVESMEKDYREMPAKIAAHIHGDLAILKKREVKLQSLLQKMQKQQKAVKNKHAALVAKAKGDVTGSAKKEIGLAKKANSMLNKALVGATKQLQKLQKQINALTLKQTKYASFKKHISKLEKEWKKQSKARTTVTKLKKKTVKKPRVSRDIHPVIPESHQEPMITESTEPESVELSS